jgi:hypothetical protein
VAASSFALAAQLEIAVIQRNGAVGSLLRFRLCHAALSWISTATPAAAKVMAIDGRARCYDSVQDALILDPEADGESDAAIRVVADQYDPLFDGTGCRYEGSKHMVVAVDGGNVSVEAHGCVLSLSRHSAVASARRVWRPGVGTDLV